jgi:hypothetical protein
LKKHHVKTRQRVLNILSSLKEARDKPPIDIVTSSFERLCLHPQPHLFPKIKRTPKGHKTTPDEADFKTQSQKWSFRTLVDTGRLRSVVDLPYLSLGDKQLLEAGSSDSYEIPSQQNNDDCIGGTRNRSAPATNSPSLRSSNRNHVLHPVKELTILNDDRMSDLDSLDNDADATFESILLNIGQQGKNSFTTARAFKRYKYAASHNDDMNSTYVDAGVDASGAHDILEDYSTNASQGDITSGGLLAQQALLPSLSRQFSSNKLSNTTGGSAGRRKSKSAVTVINADTSDGSAAGSNGTRRKSVITNTNNNVVADISFTSTAEPRQRRGSRTSVKNNDSIKGGDNVALVDSNIIPPDSTSTSDGSSQVKIANKITPTRRKSVTEHSIVAPLPSSDLEGAGANLWS